MWFINSNIKICGGEEQHKCGISLQSALQTRLCNRQLWHPRLRRPWPELSYIRTKPKSVAPPSTETSPSSPTPPAPPSSSLIVENATSPSRYGTGRRLEHRLDSGPEADAYVEKVGIPTTLIDRFLAYFAWGSPHERRLCHGENRLYGEDKEKSRLLSELFSYFFLFQS